MINLTILFIFSLIYIQLAISTKKIIRIGGFCVVMGVWWTRIPRSPPRVSRNQLTFTQWCLWHARTCHKEI